jgi:hypothetical protein
MTVKTYLTDDVPDLTDDVLGRKVLYEDPKIPNSASASSATFTTASQNSTLCIGQQDEHTCTIFRANRRPDIR